MLTYHTILKSDCDIITPEIFDYCCYMPTVHSFCLSYIRTFFLRITYVFFLFFNHRYNVGVYNSSIFEFPSCNPLNYRSILKLHTNILCTVIFYNSCFHSTSHFGRLSQN